MTALWPWLTLAGFGVFHGLNPAMGWLFAVALGLHRHSRGMVLLALPPMALGHALSIWFVAALVIAMGLVLALPACTDFKKDFLCRPAGHCVNAPDGGTGYN